MYYEINHAIVIELSKEGDNQLCCLLSINTGTCTFNGLQV